jgi:hypothetical protein
MRKLTLARHAATAWTGAGPVPSACATCRYHPLGPGTPNSSITTLALPDGRCHLERAHDG